MKRFKRILCYVGEAVDPTPGFEQAVALAARNGARLKLIDVLVDSSEGPWLKLLSKPQLEEMLLNSRRLDLEELASGARSRGVDVVIEVTTGNPFVELVRRVVLEKYDLVIKTAQGLEGRIGGLLGTTAQHLMRKCPAPVWAVKPTSDRFGRVVAAVDPRPDEAGHDPLGIKVLELASSLAEVTDSSLDIVHAWYLYAEPVLRSRRMNMPQAEIDGLLREVRGNAESALDGLVQQVDLSRVRHEVHLRKGRPDEVISEFATDADLAVMGTLSRTGIDGLLIGNTAERFLRRVDCSVLAVKPDGFRTPLRFEDTLAETAT